MGEMDSSLKYKQYYCEHAELDNEACYRNVPIGIYRSVTLCPLCYRAFAFSTIEYLVETMAREFEKQLGKHSKWRRGGRH